MLDSSLLVSAFLTQSGTSHAVLSATESVRRNGSAAMCYRVKPEPAPAPAPSP